VTTRATLKVSGMTCTGCENAVKRVLKQLNGVEDVDASHKEGTVEVTYDGDKTSVDAFKQKIEAIGYHVM
jgi:copper chaperone CopZ